MTNTSFETYSLEQELHQLCMSEQNYPIALQELLP